MSDTLEQRAISAAKTAKNMAKFRKALGIPHDQAKPLEHFPLAEPYPFEPDWREAPQ